MAERTCGKCGCTEANACRLVKDGETVATCGWVEESLCSACAPSVEAELAKIGGDARWEHPKPPLLVAHERVAARADGFLAAADPQDLGKGVSGPGLIATLTAYGLEWRDVENFCDDAVEAILAAVRGGAAPETAIGSIVLTTLLTGIEFARLK